MIRDCHVTLDIDMDAWRQAYSPFLPKYSYEKNDKSSLHEDVYVRVFNFVVLEMQRKGLLRSEHELRAHGEGL